MLSNEQIKLLKDYKDKSYVLHILCCETSNYYNYLKTMLAFPIILSSAIMTVINSSELQPNLLKPINIVINAITTIILSYINNYKIAEKSEAFKNLGNKMIKLSHEIEDRLTNDIENVTSDNIRELINSYDTLNESMLYAYPDYIKNKVLYKLKNNYVLPNILLSNTTTSSDLDDLIIHNKENIYLYDNNRYSYESKQLEKSDEETKLSLDINNTIEYYNNIPINQHNESLNTYITNEPFNLSNRSLNTPINQSIESLNIISSSNKSLNIPFNQSNRSLNIPINQSTESLNIPINRSIINQSDNPYNNITIHDDIIYLSK